MPDDLDQVTSLLAGMALFRGLKQEQIQEYAAGIESVSLAAGEELYSQGERGSSMAIVFYGKVRLSRGEGKVKQEFATLSRGDYAGEEALLHGRPYGATLSAVEPSRIIRFDKGRYSKLVRKYPYIKTHLAAGMDSRRLAGRRKFDWLTDGEVIHLAVRKSRTFLYVTLVKPVILAWLGLFLLYFGTRVDTPAFSMVMEWTGAGLVLFSFLWGGWIGLDWSNDYYIVTNKRVVWLEKVIGLYESRQEAPLSTILTVGTDSDFLGRALGYGDVSIRTYTGKLHLQNTGNPEYLARVIQEQQDRTKIVLRETETAALEQAIRRRIGLPEASAQAAPLPPQKPGQVAGKKGAAPKKVNVGIFTNFFKIRYEQGGLVTFRKHWLLLIRAIVFPTLAIVLLVALIVTRLLGYYTFLSLPFVWLVSVTLLVVLALWWIYRYVDWRNDIYQLNDEQIIDIYRKPLGAEDKKTADLDNILSLQHKRLGILGMLFNFGDVIAMVGSTEFTFDGVYNPAMVEQEIFERINARKQKKKDEEETRERERVADYLAAYHRQTEAIRKAENPPGPEQKSG